MKQKKDTKYTDKKAEEPSILKWFFTITVITFLLSMFFTYISTSSINNISLPLAILLLFLVIFVGIFFDIIAVAVTVADESNFHAKASKKVAGSKKSITLIRNAPKVSNVCADVIGDMCGVLSGAISAIISMRICSTFALNFDIQIIVGALVAALTVGGKAIGKQIANKYCSEIVNIVGKFLNLFKKK